MVELAALLMLVLLVAVAISYWRNRHKTYPERAAQDAGGGSTPTGEVPLRQDKRGWFDADPGSDSGGGGDGGGDGGGGGGD